MDATSSHLVHQAVFPGNTPRPVTGEFMPQWFGFSDTAEGVGLNRLDQAIDALENRMILTAPAQVVCPGLVRPANTHLSSLRRRVFPASTCAMPRRRCLALAGLRNK